MTSPDSVEAATQAIRALGAAWGPDVLKQTIDLFRPLHERGPAEGVARHADIAYGTHARQMLDVFTGACATSAPAGAPVVVFIHGGGFVQGERSPVPGLFYDNVPTFFARNGCVAVNATYRLAPEHRWPSGAEDVGCVVHWVRENIARFGGDPDRIVLFGHSAGAAHVAAWTLVQRIHGDGGPRVAGAILLSGVYSVQHPRFHTGAATPNQQAYYGEDASAWEGMATLGNVRRGHPPLFIGLAEYDPFPFAWPSVALAGEVTQCDRGAPRLRVVEDHNHISTVLAIDSALDPLGPDLLRFVAQATVPA
ncbi:alpha/beta hydrolase [Ramlibacter sp.]|uniref:alpha/beta hydrolase n=1 Tax=Ramlibacter sp. TaxID=1917967 RepID=UPI003D0C8CDB